MKPASLTAAAVLGLASLVAAASNNICPADAPLAYTSNGTVCGTYLSEFSQNVFYGVPFGQPPVDDLRLRHPLVYNDTYSAYSATKQPASCPGYAGFDMGIGPLSEDCLYLNVVAPSQAAENEEPLPVLVWIYGGGFDAGGIADDRFNMSYIVEQSVSIGKPILGVSINYRVGGWGFLASKEVMEDGAANIGLYDQRLALQWIKENIAGFHGDPNRIAIWGESAGAFSVGYQIIAFDGQHDGLFRAAIMDSGSMLGPALQNSTTIQEESGYQTMYDNVTATVGCSNATDSLACLRKVPYDDLFAAFEPQVYTPVLDGDFIRRAPSESMEMDLYADVAILTGSNTDEGTASFWGPRGTLNTTDDVDAYIRTLNGGALNDTDVDALLSLYPDDPSAGCPFNTGEERFASQGYMYKRGAAIAGDIYIHAGRRGLVQTFASSGSTNNKTRYPVYSYRFDQPPWDGVEELIAEVAPVYATHFVELVFVFNNPSKNISNYIGPNETYHDLSTLMSRSWASFVSDLDPNNHQIENAPYWPAYDNSNPMNIVFRTSDNEGGTYIEQDNYREEQLQWWNDHWWKLRS